MLTLLEFLRLPRTLSEIKAKVHDENLRPPSGKPLQELIEDHLLKNNLIGLEGEDCDSNADRRQKPAAKRRDSLLFRAPLFSPEAVLPITNRLQCMFSWPVAAMFMFLAIIAHAAFFRNYGLPSRTAVASLSGSQWIVFAILAYSGILIHELGHASACRHFGIRHGDIGIGLYIVYPVFYTNVTNCWSLSRWQRAVIDVGGIYFQIIFSSVCCLGWLFLHNDIIAFAILSNVVTVLVNLNPFLRFDGYWLLTDLLGVSSIHRSAYHCWRYVWHRIRREKCPDGLPGFLDVKLSSQIIVFFYSWLSAAFLLYFLKELVRAIVPHLLHTIYTDTLLMAQDVVRHDLGILSLRRSFQLVILLVTCYSLLRMGFNLWKQAIDIYVRIRERKLAQFGQRDREKRYV
jgi:putative peptide zinc metalloprotease protein